MKRFDAGSRLVLGMLAGLGLTMAAGCSAEAWGSRGAAQAGGYASVVSGMTEADVVRALGEPNSRSAMRLEGNGPQATSLRYLGHNQLINVIMVEGKVVGKQKF